MQQGCLWLILVERCEMGVRTSEVGLNLNYMMF
jgi:hypothetical protein